MAIAAVRSVRDSVKGVPVGVQDEVIGAVVLVGRRGVVGEHAIANGNRAVIEQRGGVLVEVLIGQNAVGLRTEFCTKDEFRRICGDVTTGNHGRSARNHEAANDLLMCCIPEPVTNFGVEGVFVVALPCSHAVVESHEALRAIVDRSKRLEGGDFAIGGLPNCALFVVVRDVKALVAFPLTNEAGKWSPSFVRHDYSFSGGLVT